MGLSNFDERSTLLRVHLTAGPCKFASTDLYIRTEVDKKELNKAYLVRLPKQGCVNIPPFLGHSALFPRTVTLRPTLATQPTSSYLAEVHHVELRVSCDSRTHLVCVIDSSERRDSSQAQFGPVSRQV